jgi:hypothetical protein
VVGLAVSYVILILLVLVAGQAYRLQPQTAVLRLQPYYISAPIMARRDLRAESAIGLSMVDLPSQRTFTFISFDVGL